ncbi:hypothetical protein CMQ_6802 [Grosmannia clavigera kw1407]|uniref:Uncharacterized protein n=1 Tax=Grosmannia clavigera (strain kw1407 / UAMH 11150) TaxID=655863 RepID=F0X774_GROCL|nr:uncharacterized protein CMQ_6802 [Grosmannia clavigera kw1407]EFX06481.1 hypothetical protein CMQ_6802 [Grosmannia clavigera kw1407]
MMASQESKKKETRPRRFRRRHAACPDPDSLYDIMRQNCGTSLYVLPILWTDVHRRLLSVDFVARDQRPAAAVDATTMRPSELAEALSADLTSLLSPEDTRPFCKSRAIKSVLATLYPTALSRPKSVAELDLHFGDRSFRGAVRVPVVWQNGVDAADLSFDSAVTRAISSFGLTQSSQAATPAAPNGPLMAYVNRAHLSMIRQNLFRIVPGPETGDYQNTPVRRLQTLRSKHLVPADPDRDPYLVSVFLAMAQANFYDPGLSSAAQAFWRAGRPRERIAAVAPDLHDIKLRIITHDDETIEFIVYTATVTEAFLRRFAAPTKASSAAQTPDVGMHIEHERVAVWPILGLKQRLGRALGQDLVGDLQDESSLFAAEAEAPNETTEPVLETMPETVPEPQPDSQPESEPDTQPESLPETQPETQPESTPEPTPETQPETRPKTKREAVSPRDSRKRKRTDRRSLKSTFNASLKAEKKEASSGVAVSSPALSPHSKRPRTRSFTSLAVF